MTLDGFPHSDIPGSKPACGSPRLIAADHVLHRLSAPRHPPCTLSSLTKLDRLLEPNFLDSRRILSLLTRFSCQRSYLPSPLPATGISGIRATVAPAFRPGVRSTAHSRILLPRFPTHHCERTVYNQGRLQLIPTAASSSRQIQRSLVELIGLEPTTSALQGRRSRN